MKIDSFYYDVRVNLIATDAELDYMIDCSKHHYDWACKDASSVASSEKRTVNGFLTVWRGCLQFDLERLERGKQDPPTTYGLTFHQLDLLCKIIENGENRDLYYELRKILRDVGDKACEVNGIPKPERGPILHPMIESAVYRKPKSVDTNMKQSFEGRWLPGEEKA